MGPKTQCDDKESERPPLPPRPSLLDALHGNGSAAQAASRPTLVSLPTTAISSTSVHSEIAADSTHAIDRSAPASSLGSRKGSRADLIATVADVKHRLASPDSSPAASLGGETIESSVQGKAISQRDSDDLDDSRHVHHGRDDLDEFAIVETGEIDEERAFFEEEFSSITADASSEEEAIAQWRSKHKHYLILSKSGKPIWQRHGSDRLISSYVGAIQTIISLFENSNDSLRSLTAGDARIVVVAQGPLYSVAISRLGESDSQLRSQLDALYMQILSTLTLPHLTRIFSLSPSSDLRKPLQGTEALLSSLADSFTRGSPSTLLSSLECLRLRNRHRQAINSVLLKKRCPELLYGLVVAGGRLVSVVRPKTHSLHPGDLQLIFNMLFKADGVQAGGGESWIPMCLPGFNKNGYLYMYVSYLDEQEEQNSNKAGTSNSNRQRQGAAASGGGGGQKEDNIAVLLISSKKEAFFELQSCRNAIISSMQSSGLLAIIGQALAAGRPAVNDIVPGGSMIHFLYKSRGNLQLLMPSWRTGHNKSTHSRRFLMSIYENLHANLHARGSQLKVQHSASDSSTNLAWLTEVFELYCVAEPYMPKHVVIQAANRVIQWVRKEEERVFIIGGAVF